VTGIHKSASVLALVPHYRCEEWLGDALQSLLDQTRPVDGIAVIDDASPDDGALRSVAARYPRVTFLRADRNVGPYALIQQTIDDTGYDAYLFQDADDWSAPDRLETLLVTAERTDAELVGTWELRVLCDAGEVMPVSYPVDASAALADDPTAFALLHPTSLVSHQLVDRVGGYSTGMRFSGDAEFLWRAAPVARIANAAGYCYHRRKRAGSLTTASTTGLQSAARLELHERLRAAARRRREAMAAGDAVDLTPHATALDPVTIEHVAGPALRRSRVTAVTV
jgi:glycosyltransferase involved in cell wall biosynthesis